VRFTWPRATGLVLAALLILSGNYAWAQAPAPAALGSRHGRHGLGPRLFGTVASVSPDSLVLTTWTGRTVTLTTTPATRALSHQRASLTDLASGDLVRILATRTSNGTLVARRVSDIPASLAMSHPSGGATPERPRAAGGQRMHSALVSGRDGLVMVAGPVVSVADGTVSVAMPVGSPMTVSVPPTTRITRLTAPAVTNLAPGTHVIIRTRRLRRPQQPGGTTAAVRPSRTAVIIFVVPATTRRHPSKAEDRQIHPGLPSMGSGDSIFLSISCHRGR
jgi:hypothetical protein